MKFRKRFTGKKIEVVPGPSPIKVQSTNKCSGCGGLGQHRLKGYFWCHRCKGSGFEYVEIQ